MPLKTPLIEAIIKEVAHLGTIAQRHEALAHIARWQDTKLIAQLARRAAIICHIDERCDLRGILPQACQERKAPRPAADDDDACSTIALCHVLFLPIIMTT